MSRTYFVSDLHHGHKSICKYRSQFSNTAEHDQYICDRILSTCGKRDTLWILGDSFFTLASLDYFHAYVGNISQVNIVLGNHCTDNTVRQDNVKYMAQHCHKIGALFSYKGFWLSHAPIHPDQLRGKQNIHGHMHDDVLVNDDYFSVCLEQINYEPIKFSTIKEIMAG